MPAQSEKRKTQIPASQTKTKPQKSPGGITAINRQSHPTNHRSRFAKQKQNRLSNFPRYSEPLKRNSLERGIALGRLAPCLHRHRRQSDRRINAIHANPIPSKLDTQNPRNRIHRSFRSAITQMILKPNQRRLARNIHDTARALRIDHRPRNMPRNQSRAASINVHHRIKTGARSINSAFKHRRARTIHQPIEHIERRKRLINRGLISDVEHKRLAPRLLRKTSQLANVARRRNNLRATRAQHLNSHAADAARCARHEYRAPGKIEGRLHFACSRCMTGFNAGYRSV